MITTSSTNSISTCVLFCAFCLYIVVQYIPVRWVLDSRYVIDIDACTETNESDWVQYDDITNDVTATFDSLRGYPLIIKPANPSLDLQQFVTDHLDWINAKLQIHGAILYRGFDVNTPQQFEQVSLALEPALQEVYLGTSPRELQPNCSYVHSASEFPGWKVIPSHAEMSFLTNPPSRQFFYAYQPNSSPGGETPVVDFRQVLRDMDPQVLQRFKDKRIRYIRHYYDSEQPTSLWDNHLDHFKTKSWQKMFYTNNSDEVEYKCAQQSFSAQWSDPKQKRGTLKLVHTMDAVRLHPETGDEIWHNHMNVLHIDSWLSEFAFSAQHLNSWMHAMYHYIFRGVVAFQRYFMYGGDIERFGQHTTHENGEPMTQDDIDYIRRLVWKNTFIYRHEKNDVVMIDNFRMGHGRQPYTGDRTILTTWA